MQNRAREKEEQLSAAMSDIIPHLIKFYLIIYDTEAAAIAQSV